LFILRYLQALLVHCLQ